ncbi:MAG: GNAT family N-acetyltransferase [Anaerolineales bacterium]|jgi:ribosomal protein S18 acetylase RimI-like enzyme
MIEITPLQPGHLPQAALIFLRNLQQLRQSVPALPDTMEDPELVRQYLVKLLEKSGGLAALEHDRLVGYLAWMLVSGFRGTKRKAAYVPEWAHGTAGGNPARVYRALYRAAAEAWSTAGCQVHAISLLAHDHTATNTWFWNGFGLQVVDAVRPMMPLGQAVPAMLEIRKASAADAELVNRLDQEHWQHYPQSPIFMVPQVPSTPEAFRLWLAQPKNSLWLAFAGGAPAGFVRFDGYDFDGVAVIDAPTGIFISGAYVRPAYRSLGAASALLDAALRDYQQQGFEFCSVNFETFNPEAAAFWPRYFEPACLSLTRFPENLPTPSRL